MDSDEVLKAFYASWEESCRDEQIFFPKGKDAESLAEQGRKLVEVLLENLGEAKVLAVEQSFEVEIELPNGEKRILTGFFDAVLLNEDGRVTVWELKTSSTAYNDFKLEDDIQAAVYAYAARTLYGPDVRLAYGVLIKKKEPTFQTVDVNKDEADFARLASLVQVAEALLDAAIVYPSPTWMCSGCGFRSPCAEWGRSRRRRQLPLAVSA